MSSAKHVLAIHPDRIEAARVKHANLLSTIGLVVTARSRMVASTGHFTLYSDGTAAGDHAVAQMQAVCEADYATLQGLFAMGDVPNLPFVVHVDANAGGAYHLSCEGTEIWLIAEDAPTLLVAEVVEVFEAFARGWDCGLTNGEGLSRALAATVRPPQLLGDIDGDVQGWWNSGSPADHVNDNSASDGDTAADACGTLFLYYLRSQLGYTWNSIDADGAADLGATYALLTGRTGAQGFQDFVGTLRQLDQGGQLVVPTSGNPFPLGNVPQPSPPPPAPPPPPPQPPPQPPDLPESWWWEELEQLWPGFTEWIEQHYGWRKP